MNREILFKAKRLSDGEWVEGNIVNVPADADFMPGAYILPRLVSARADPPTKGIMLGGFFEVDPSTVCQYTGLTDKNGKKIFEGDIVRRETAYYGKRNVYDEPVVWEDDIENDSFGEPYTSGYCIHGGNWEVIGNIHDGEGGQREEG